MHGDQDNIAEKAEQHQEDANDTSNATNREEETN